MTSKWAVLTASILWSAGLLLSQLPAAAQTGEPQPDDVVLPKVVPAKILAEQFDKLREIIRPKPGGFDDVPWMTDLWQARKKAAAEGKPILIWVGDGHPLGWT